MPAQTPRIVSLSAPRGVWSGGDGATIPAGHCRRLRNARKVNDVWTKRPRLVFDTLANVHSLALWDDTDADVTRLVAIDTSGNLRVKSLADETWGSVLGTVTGTRLVSYASYRGKLWGAMDDGAGTPVSLFSFDGLTVDSAPLSSSIVGELLLFYKSRMHILHPRVTITNLLPWQAAYSASAYAVSGGLWSLSNVDARDVFADGPTVIGEVIPFATTGAYLYHTIKTVSGTTEPQVINWLSHLHNTATNYQMPITLEIHIKHAWAAAAAYVADEIVTPSASNGYRYRCVTAGTSGATEPATWTTTIGATVADGTVTWLCDATNVAPGGQYRGVIPSAALQPSYSLYSLQATLPPTPTNYTVEAHIIFGNESSPTIELWPIHIGFRDGLADGDKSKKNFGQQVTNGDYFFPFFNVESDTPPVIDLDQDIWSEVAEPGIIRAANSFSFSGAAGYPQAAILFDGRMYVGKRRSYIALVPSSDENLVILPETEETLGIGYLAQQAIAVHAGVLYWIAENSVYSLRAGAGQVPVDICGDKMRGEIMAKGSRWVENRTSPCNTPLLEVDSKFGHIYVYTQSGKVFIFDIRSGAWSTMDAGGDSSADPIGQEISAMRYNPVTGHMYFAFGTAALGVPGLARLDASMAGPQNGLQLVARILAADSDTTFDRSLSMTLSPATHEQFRPIEFPVFQSGNSVQVDMLFLGGGDDQISTLGTSPMYMEFAPRPLETYPETDVTVDMIRFRCRESATAGFAIAEIEAEVSTSEYYPKIVPTFGASTL